MSKVKVSIITVCYNSSKTIRQTFESLLAQTDLDFEYIVVDGSSKDDTIEIIKSYTNKFQRSGINFHWISEPDSGIYDAMNKGILNTKGEIIGILNSDDQYFPDTIKLIKEYSNQKPEYDVYHGLLENINHGQVVSIVGHSSDTLYTGMIEHPTCFVRRATYDKFGRYNTNYRFAADLDMMLRIKIGGGKFILIPHLLSRFNENGAGNSKKSRDEAINIQLEYHLISRFKGFIKFLMNHMV